MTVLEKGVEATAASTPPRRRRSTGWLLTVGLVVALLVLVPVAAGLGAYPIPTGDVLASVQHRLGLGGGALDRVPESVLWNVRFPRIVLALLVGASLGCAGALMQGVFGNPLAEPGVIGVSSGAAAVVVLHDLALAAAYAHRVAILRAGRVAADGPPGVVFTEELLSDVYDQQVEVFPHPRTGAAVVTPHRPA